MANISISIDGIDQAIQNLKYRPNSVKFKAVQAIRAYYETQDTISTLFSIDTDQLIRSIWDIGSSPSKLKAKRRNFSSIKSSINADLEKLAKKDLNPENLIITDSNVFDMTEEAKSNLLSSFTDAVKTGDIDIDQATTLLRAVTDFLDSYELEGTDGEPHDIVNQIRQILNRIGEDILQDDDEEGDSDKGLGDGDEDEDLEEIEIDEDQEIEDLDEDFEEVELDEDEDIEEIELDEDEELEEIDDDFELIDEDEDLEEIEIDEDQEIEDLDEDVEEVELDEDEDIEEIELDEELEEIDDDFELIDEDEDLEEIEIDEDQEIEDLDEDFEEVELDEDEDIEEIELDEDEELEEIDDDFELIDEDDDIEEIEIDEDQEIEDLDEDVEEVELDEDEEIEEIELDEDEEIEEIELDEDEEIEEIQLDEDEELEDIDELDDDELKALEEFREKRELAEHFDGALGEREKKFNKYTTVPEGYFTIGSKKSIKSSLELQQFFMPKVYIGIYPVTNALFEIFIEETGYITTAEKFNFGRVYTSNYQKIESGAKWSKISGSSDVQGACWYQPHGPGSNLHGKRNHPVVQVSVEDAMVFASWIGRRLPTEAEWEAAARTDQGYNYPWGDEFKNTAMNIESAGLGDTSEVDRYDAFANEFNICDMLGNVMEWTSDTQIPPVETKRPTPYSVAKGAAWNAKDTISISSRALFKPNFTANTIGFRCTSEIFQ